MQLRRFSMADDRYGDDGRREGWRGREGSIFSDDDDRWSRGGKGRWSRETERDRGPSGGDDDRGFFERAGDEVRSWFGDEEAERRRETDTRRDEGREGQDRTQGGPRGGAYAGSRTNYGSASAGPDQGRGGRSHWDENYRRWRDQQIEQFDREYEDYCRERQQQFDQDFSSWRSSRLTQGGTSGQFGGGGSQSGEDSRDQGSSGVTAGNTEPAAATTTAGGTGSALESSTGSSGGGRGSRSRS
jgi:hypothetical protein